jgi:hypothetical protein
MGNATFSACNSFVGGEVKPPEPSAEPTTPATPSRGKGLRSATLSKMITALPNDLAQPLLHLDVETMDHAVFPMSVELKDSIGLVKQRFHYWTTKQPHFEELAPELQRIIWQGEELHDHETLEQIQQRLSIWQNLAAPARVHVVRKLPK